MLRIGDIMDRSQSNTGIVYCKNRIMKQDAFKSNSSQIQLHKNTLHKCLIFTCSHSVFRETLCLLYFPLFFLCVSVYRKLLIDVSLNSNLNYERTSVQLYTVHCTIQQIPLHAHLCISAPGHLQKSK